MEARAEGFFKERETFFKKEKTVPLRELGGKTSSLEEGKLKVVFLLDSEVCSCSFHWVIVCIWRVRAQSLSFPLPGLGK